MSGIVTNIAVVAGQSVPADTPLATVLPKGSGMHVELLVPSRAIGFIQRGSRWCCATRPSPTSASASTRASITEIGRNVWTPGEKIGPLAVKEPVYRVDVKLERQSVAALGAGVSRCGPACS